MFSRRKSEAALSTVRFLRIPRSQQAKHQHQQQGAKSPLSRNQLLLLVAILAKAFLALVRRHLVTFAFFSTRHVC